MKSLFFFGELPPTAVHGISLSNELNIKILSDYFKIKIVEEVVPLRLHNKFSIMKICIQGKNILHAVSNLIFFKYDLLYLCYSVSFFGSLKNLIIIKTYKFFNETGVVVVHLHRGDFYCYIKNKKNKFISEKILNSVDKMICLSEKYIKYFNRYKNLEAKILRNTVYVSDNYKNNENENENENINIIYLSNYIKEKGIIDLLKAFSVIKNKYPHVFLSCYGNFSDPSLKTEICSFNSNQISINGPIYGRDKFRKISESNLLILPSWSEGQPLILLEAMALGVPILTTSTGDIYEMLGEDYQFIYSPGDINALTYMIIDFLDFKNPRKISKYFIDRFSKYYSPESHRKNLLNIFID